MNAFIMRVNILCNMFLPEEHILQRNLVAIVVSPDVRHMRVCHICVISSFCYWLTLVYSGLCYVIPLDKMDLTRRRVGWLVLCYSGFFSAANIGYILAFPGVPWWHTETAAATMAAAILLVNIFAFESAPIISRPIPCTCTTNLR